MNGGDSLLALGLLDSLNVGIVGLDHEDRPILQNAEASRLLGFSADHARRARLPRLLAAGHPILRLVEQVRATGREFSAPASVFPPKAGAEGALVDLSAAPWEPAPGREGVAVSLFDRTLGRELEVLVDQRMRDELFERLAAGIAHEIRNPLSGISGAAELLQRKLDDPSLGRYPALIRGEADRICRLLDDLGQLTRGSEVRHVPTNLHQVLDNLIDLQRQSPSWRQIDIRREYDPSLPDLSADPDRLVQVFLNLVRNAVQAMKGEGRLTITTRFESLFRFSEGDRTRCRMVRIDVEDTGPGIAEEDLPHIFTPFYTKGEGGTGLGLAIAQHWVVRHGGRILALRAHTGGARMRVLLPVGEQR
jgi:two-component system, NtrC family, nitrogen regulation sensor histidine kinase GlnL